MNIIEMVKKENIGKIFGCDFNSTFKYKVVKNSNGVFLETKDDNGEWYKIPGINEHILNWDFFEIKPEIEMTIKEILNDVKISSNIDKYLYKIVSETDESNGYVEFDSLMYVLSFKYSACNLVSFMKESTIYVKEKEK